ncbi:MAG: hypothetical protein KDN05_11710, partial [Verrucomicrobiae bacterium]|nr:hypothetical protein [Verrucomicrobiae bacterium]
KSAVPAGALRHIRRSCASAPSNHDHLVSKNFMRPHQWFASEFSSHPFEVEGLMRAERTLLDPALCRLVI